MTDNSDSTWFIVSLTLGFVLVVIVGALVFLMYRKSIEKRAQDDEIAMKDLKKNPFSIFEENMHPAVAQGMLDMIDPTKVCKNRATIPLSKNLISLPITIIPEKKTKNELTSNIPNPFTIKTEL